MKIALCATHQGLIDMLQALLAHHEVHVYSNTVYYDTTFAFQDEDVIISTFPYKELPFLDGSKPVILYASDPFPNLQAFLAIQDAPWLTIVGDTMGESSYLKNYPVHPTIHIPHSINPTTISAYTGEKPAVAIVSRKPFMRWSAIITRHHPEGMLLEEFLSTIPYHVLHIPNRQDFFSELARFRAVFYYSNNPYTLMMYELMAMGMPMVAYSHSYGTTHALDYYGIPHSTEAKACQQLLTVLLKTPTKQAYPLPSFEDVQQQWEEVLCAIK